MSLSKVFSMEIQALKSHLSILDIASKLGIMVNKQGRAHCPFHEDKTPSLQFRRRRISAPALVEAILQMFSTSARF
jgi:hypothetical protein